MRSAANTTISILRGTEVNGYGDTVDSDTPIYTHVVAAILETSRRTYLPAEGAHRVIRSYAGRVGAEVDLRKDDRVRDERTNIVYLVTDLQDPAGFGLAGGMLLDLKFTLSRTT